MCMCSCVCLCVSVFLSHALLCSEAGDGARRAGRRAPQAVQLGSRGQCRLIRPRRLWERLLCWFWMIWSVSKSHLSGEGSFERRRFEAAEGAFLPSSEVNAHWMEAILSYLLSTSFTFFAVHAIFSLLSVLHASCFDRIKTILFQLPNSHSNSISYENTSPLMIVRGEGCYLIDEKGKSNSRAPCLHLFPRRKSSTSPSTGYLDTRNNVNHVGHQNKKVLFSFAIFSSCISLPCLVVWHSALRVRWLRPSHGKSLSWIRTLDTSIQMWHFWLKNSWG